MKRRLWVIACVLIAVVAAGTIFVPPAESIQCNWTCGDSCEWPNCEMWLCHNKCWQCAEGCSSISYDSWCDQLLCVF